MVSNVIGPDSGAVHSNAASGAPEPPQLPVTALGPAVRPLQTDGPIVELVPRIAHEPPGASTPSGPESRGRRERLHAVSESATATSKDEMTSALIPRSPP